MLPPPLALLKRQFASGVRSVSGPPELVQNVLRTPTKSPIAPASIRALARKCMG